MSSKPKALLKQSKSKHKKEQKLDTADDFQAAGVDLEDAAGKWRAGDAIKSMRFFHRALEVYEQGLQSFPTSFDLAYNKARVQLEIATHPVLVSQLRQPVLTVLQAALESHRYALNLDQENPDTLFNTAQVLTSIAEEVAKSDVLDDADAIQYLEEALSLQDRCLSLQEFKYEESLQQQNQALEEDTDDAETINEDDEDGGAPVGSSTKQEEQWFSIVEPITEDSLIDTALAQLSTLTTLCAILSNSPVMAPQATLAWVEEYSSRILDKKLSLLVKHDSDRLQEIALVKANFVSALLEAGFRGNKLDATTYKRERDGVFSLPELVLETSIEALIANARSLIAFNSALIDSRLETDHSLATTRWNALAAAITSLVTCSKIAGITTEDLATTHFLRGDCSMLQHWLGLPPISYPNAVSNASQLLKNAEVFYKNASKLSLDTKEKAVAGFRSCMSQYIQNQDVSVITSASKGMPDSWVASEVEDMVLEGLLPPGFRIS